MIAIFSGDYGNSFATTVAVQLRRENGTGAGFAENFELGSYTALFGIGVTVVSVILSAMNPPSTFIKHLLACEPYTSTIKGQRFVEVVCHKIQMRAIKIQMSESLVLCRKGQLEGPALRALLGPTDGALTNRVHWKVQLTVQC